MTDTPAEPTPEGVAAQPEAPPPLPDRLSNNPGSRFYNEDLLARGIGIRFNGRERENVDEYCVSEGWMRVRVGRSLDRNGYPITTRLNGRIEPFIKGAA